MTGFFSREEESRACWDAGNIARIQSFHYSLSSYTEGPLHHPVSRNLSLHGGHYLDVPSPMTYPVNACSFEGVLLPVHSIHPTAASYPSTYFCLGFQKLFSLDLQSLIQQPFSLFLLMPLFFPVLLRDRNPLLKPLLVPSPHLSVSQSLRLVTTLVRSRSLSSCACIDERGWSKINNCAHWSQFK